MMDTVEWTAVVLLLYGVIMNLFEINLIRLVITTSRFFQSESWVSWDDGASAVDVNGDGLKNEQDAFARTLTIMGQCMERGLNTMQFPWSDNSSGWAMGLTKRRDYNGRMAIIAPDKVIPSNDGGPDIITQKIRLAGNDDNFQIQTLDGDVFTIDNYINPPDPNHLHYYVWRWFSQIAAGANEVIRHAVAGELR
jgi:hypothetical protein